MSSFIFNDFYQFPTSWVVFCLVLILLRMLWSYWLFLSIFLNLSLYVSYMWYNRCTSVGVFGVISCLTHVFHASIYCTIYCLLASDHGNLNVRWIIGVEIQCCVYVYTLYFLMVPRYYLITKTSSPQILLSTAFLIVNWC